MSHFHNIIQLDPFAFQLTSPLRHSDYAGDNRSTIFLLSIFSTEYLDTNLPVVYLHRACIKHSLSIHIK